MKPDRVAMFNVTRILHASLIVSDLDRSLRFYHGILGLQVDVDRPDLGFPGAWLKIEDQQIHLLQLDNPDPVTGRPEHGGRDRHVAFTVTDLDALSERLTEVAIPYTLSRSGRRALFCRDPDGNALEFVEE